MGEAHGRGVNPAATTAEAATSAAGVTRNSSAPAGTEAALARRRAVVAHSTTTSTTNATATATATVVRPVLTAFAKAAAVARPAAAEENHAHPLTTGPAAFITGRTRVATVTIRRRRNAIAASPAIAPRET